MGMRDCCCRSLGDGSKEPLVGVPPLGDCGNALELPCVGVARYVSCLHLLSRLEGFYSDI